MKASEKIGEGPTPAPSAKAALGVGDPKLTVQKRKEFSEYRVDAATNGQPEQKWEEWLDGNGYGLDAYGHVFKKSGE